MDSVPSPRQPGEWHPRESQKTHFPFRLPTHQTYKVTASNIIRAPMQNETATITHTTLSSNWPSLQSGTGDVGCGTVTATGPLVDRDMRHASINSK